MDELPSMYSRPRLSRSMRAVAFDENEGLVPGRAPVVHRGERMPQVTLVCRDQAVGVPITHARRAG